METKGKNVITLRTLFNRRESGREEGYFSMGSSWYCYIYFKDSGVDLNCFFNVLLFFFALDSMLRLDHEGDQLY